ncbi:MAG: hypothetical protein OHK0026_00330 [Rhodocyclaceae bacterium]
MLARILALLALLLGFAATGGAGGDVRPAPAFLSELPPEAAATLERIRRGGPFPYRQDGAVFHNREGRLPAKPAAYYREYTVPAPRARDRGARRIVAGAGGEYYYSGDHYRSFRRISE